MGGSYYKCTDFYETEKYGTAKVDKQYQLYWMESVEEHYLLYRRRVEPPPELPHHGIYPSVLASTVPEAPIPTVRSTDDGNWNTDNGREALGPNGEKIRRGEHA